MDTQTRAKYESQSQDLRADLKTWENDWAKTNRGKKPSRDDIKQNPDIGMRSGVYFFTPLVLTPWPAQHRNTNNTARSATCSPARSLPATSTALPAMNESASSPNLPPCLRRHPPSATKSFTHRASPIPRPYPSGLPPPPPASPRPPSVALSSAQSSQHRLAQHHKKTDASSVSSISSPAPRHVQKTQTQPSRPRPAAKGTTVTLPPPPAASAGLQCRRAGSSTFKD